MRYLILWCIFLASLALVFAAEESKTHADNPPEVEFIDDGMMDIGNGWEQRFRRYHDTKSGIEILCVEDSCVSTGRKW